MTDYQPIACNLTKIDETGRALHKRNGESVFKAVRNVKELSKGYAFKLPAETDIIERAGAFVARERLCCPFFVFTLEVTSGHGPVWLHLSGDKEVKRFIARNIIPQLNLDSDAR